MTNHFREIEDLFSGYFSGELSEKERKLVDQWRRESSENEKIFKVASTAWGSVLMLDEMEKYNSFGALKAVNSRLPASRSIRWIFYFQRFAAIVLFPLLVYAAYVEINNQKLSEKMNPQAIWQSVTTNKDMISQFVLPDSTRVCLNSGSNLQFPYTFAKEKREVKLTGEAYFKVTKDKKSPFVIHADKLEITVLGTTLNVISHAGQSSEVILISGKVALSVNNGKESISYGELKPGQLAIFNNQTETIQFETVDVEKLEKLKLNK
jgi:ferric-dicitrate binding protein FerR (iron transport regulator)